MQRFLFLVTLLTISLVSGCGGGASTGLAQKPTEEQVQKVLQEEKQVEEEERGAGKAPKTKKPR